MTKRNSIIIIILSGLFLFSACIKQEALNKEADILSIHVNQDVLKRAPVISNDDIVCYVKSDTLLADLAPTFTITPGARMVPKSGTPRDFTKPQIYTVYSEDGEWHKDYTVSFRSFDMPKKYHFDHSEIKYDKYQDLYEVDESGNKSMTWASGNIGFAIIAGDLPSDKYPTSMAQDGFVNHAVKLVTCSTGPLGENFGTPLAAGNLFIGSFHINITNPLASTHFGMPIYEEPLSLKGYCKYQSGEVFKRYTDENGNAIPGGEVLPNQSDSCAIYAVFYETDADTPHLDGTNILTHSNVVSVAHVIKGDDAADWTAFEAPFVMREGKAIDQQKLKEGKYNLTIVLTSSKDGQLYNGAIGSTLFVDEIELVTQ